MLPVSDLLSAPIFIDNNLAVPSAQGRAPDAISMSSKSQVTQTTALTAPRTPSRRRLAFLLVLLVGLCVTIIATRYPGWREQRLARQSLDQLQSQAAYSDAGPDVHMLYGEKLIATDKVPEALAEFQKAARGLKNDQKDSLAARVHARLGYTLTQLNEDEEALPHLHRAERLNEDDPLVHLGFGTIFLHRHLNAYAIIQFKLAVELDPQNSDAHLLLGKAHNLNVEPQAAVEELNKAIALTPNSAEAHSELGNAYAYQGQFPNATAEFRRALELSPGNKNYQYVLGAALGMSARSREDYLEAVTMLDKSMKDEPENDMMAFTLGQLHLRFQNLEGARRFLKRAIELKPSNIEAWYNLGRVEQLLGNQKEAGRDTREYQRLMVLHDGAIIAEKKVAANVHDPKARLELARCYRATGNFVGAFWQLKTALMLQPDFPEAQQQLQQVGPEYQRVMAQSNGAAQLKDVNVLGPPPPEEFQSAMAGSITAPKQ